MSLKCLLCGNGKLKIADRLTGLQLKSLWSELGRTFTPDAWGPIKDRTIVERYGCESCGFLFSDPSLTGNEAFYRQLEHAEYYSPHREEFSRTLRFARKHNLTRVLDVGCGSGIFLDMARQQACNTFGVELNSRAAQKARGKGHTIFSWLLSDLHLEQTGGSFDLITLFQVLEHVPDPVKTLTEAKSLLKTGGFLAVAVPSADGLCRLAPWDPGLWPPHHISLWRLPDFKTLASAIGMVLVESGGDTLVGSGILHRWDLHNRLAPLVGRPKLPGSTTLPRLISLVYRKLGLKYFLPMHGSSVYAFLQKP